MHSSANTLHHLVADAMRLLIGIDPGITGAMAAINADTLQLHAVVDFPTVSEGKKQRIFTYGTADILKQWESDADRIAMVYLEKVNAMPKQGVTSMFNMGRSFGAIEGVISALNLPLTYITPVTWKRRANLINKDKDVSRTRALELYPSAPLTRKKDHNRADALLIARYGQAR